MTDLHTHILPGMDDGAKTVEESLAMLRMEREQGVDTVVLTPHFYRDRENPKHFLQRREKAVAALERGILALPEKERAGLPRLLTGAEVAWAPNLSDWEELPRLCLGGTSNLLLELPFSPWTDRMIDQIYDLMSRTGVTPVIAHLERYLKLQRGERIREVLDLGVPVQVSGDALLRVMGRSGALKLLKNRQAHLLASDCHNCDRRAPTLAAAVSVARRKLGDERAEALLRCADELAGI